MGVKKRKAAGREGSGTVYDIVAESPKEREAWDAAHKRYQTNRDIGLNIEGSEYNKSFARSVLSPQMGHKESRLQLLDYAPYAFLAAGGTLYHVDSEILGSSYFYLSSESDKYKAGSQRAASDEVALEFMKGTQGRMGTPYGIHPFQKKRATAFTIKPDLEVAHAANKPRD